jgi:hypothetical protein
MLRLTGDEHHFHYERHRVEIHGVCAECRGRDLAGMSAPSALRRDRSR